MSQVFIRIRKTFRQWKIRHDWLSVQVEGFNFVKDFNRILQCIRDICKEFVHLLFRLEPLLAGVPHAVRIIHELACIHAQQPVMSLCINLIQEMNIVGCQ